MLILASFMSTHFAHWRRRRDPRPISDGPPTAPSPAYEGALAAFDFDSGGCLWMRTFDTPTGFALADDRIYLNSMYGSRTLVLDAQLRLCDVIGTRHMNDLHSVVLTDRGLLVTSCGVDAVLEVDTSGSELWSWFAWEHGYSTTLRGRRRRLDGAEDYRRAGIDTVDQSTHCNSALRVRHAGRDVVLATLFHQGHLIAIDPDTGRVRTLVTGMNNPHSIRPRGDGWILCDTAAGAVVLLDHGFAIEDVIESRFSWVQDAVSIDDETLLVADANNYRMVVWDVAGRRRRREVVYDDEWKIYQVEVLDGDWERRLREIA